MCKSWKRVTGLLLGASLVLGLTACGGSGSTATTATGDANSNENVAAVESTVDTSETDKEEITLNVWHQWSNDTNELKAKYEEAVAAYEEEHPNVTIHSETLDTEAYKMKINAEFAGDASGIDVFYWWGAGTAKKFVEADKLLALDEYITDDVRSKMLEGSTGAFEYNGKLYSVPMFSWYMTLFCNKALFDEAGATIPTTYAELVDAVEKLSKLDGITPMASGAKDGWNAAFMYQALALREVGAENVNAMLQGEVPFGEDEGYAEAANKVIELYNLGAFGKNPLEGGNDDANAAFGSGKAAMRLTGSWYANSVYTDEQTTIDPANVVAVGIPMIEGKGNASDYCGGFVESFWVNNNTKYPEEAAKFAIYINEKMGVACYETGSGFSGWTTEADESNLNPLFIQIKELLANGKNGVLAWDTSLDSVPATVHNEQTQTLFAPGADVDAFIKEHEGVINN